MRLEVVHTNDSSPFRIATEVHNKIIHFRDGPDKIVEVKKGKLLSAWKRFEAETGIKVKYNQFHNNKNK
jgi:hypothetical protein